MQRNVAAEFSFFLAVPTLSGAALIKTLGLLRGKDGGLSGTDSLLTNDQIWALGLGTVFAFIFAAIAIRFFIALVSRFGFKHFGYYRIVLGLFILAIAVPELQGLKGFINPAESKLTFLLYNLTLLFVGRRRVSASG